MKLFHRLCSVLLIVFLTGCVTVLPREAISQLKRVGVVSQTGDSLYKQYVGVTLFGNKDDLQDISAWKLDEIYEEQLAAAVRVVLKAEPLVLTQYRPQFGDVNSLNGPYSAPAFWGPNFDRVRDATRRACQEQALDAVIVVARWQTTDILGRTNLKVEGVGVYATGRTGMAHVLSKVGFMDCKSGNVLASRPLVKPATTQSDSFGARILTAPLDSAVAEKAYSAWSPVEKDHLRTILSSLPVDAWESTLLAMMPSQ